MALFNSETCLKVKNKRVETAFNRLDVKLEEKTFFKNFFSAEDKILKLFKES